MYLHFLFFERSLFLKLRFRRKSWVWRRSRLLDIILIWRNVLLKSIIWRDIFLALISLLLGRSQGVTLILYTILILIISRYIFLFIKSMIMICIKLGREKIKLIVTIIKGFKLKTLRITLHNTISLRISPFSAYKNL